MSSTSEIASAFIHGAPPGELQDVVNDIQTLTSDIDPSLISKLKPAFQKYNEDQLTTTELPGEGIRTVLISKYNRLPDGRYFDTESKTSFEFDHITQKASSPQPYTHPSPHHDNDLIPALLKAFSAYASEHYAASSSTYGIYPTTTTTTTTNTTGSNNNADEEEQESLALILVSNKYSPTNFWNGRWRCTYLLTPPKTTPSSSTSSSPSSMTATLTGSISITVHYYEDGNVRLSTHKPLSLTIPFPHSSPSSTSASSAVAETVVQKIAQAERAYQSELNTAFVRMNEEGFKALRRQLPVTRQKVEWDKVGGYRLGSDLRGGAAGGMGR